MDDYREYVNAVALAANGKEIIQNKTPDHASVLIGALLNKAVREVLIVSGALDCRAYGTEEVMTAATHFLSLPEAQLKIVVERPITFEGCKFLRHLRDLGALADGRVTLFRTTTPAPFHFLLADGQHFRFEADPAKPEAIAQFGAPSVELRNAFDIIVSTSEVLTPV